MIKHRLNISILILGNIRTIKNDTKSKMIQKAILEKKTKKIWNRFRIIEKELSELKKELRELNCFIYLEHEINLN